MSTVATTRIVSLYSDERKSDPAVNAMLLYSPSGWLDLEPFVKSVSFTTAPLRS